MSDNNTSVLYIFPGQGSQYRGIGSDLHESCVAVRQVYEEANDALGFDLRKLSFEDPDNQVHLTRFTQPVLLTHSIACLRALEEKLDGRVSASIAAGHSLGEYTALVAAGALSFDLAVRLVHVRGTLMSKYGTGEMEALPLEFDEAAAFADRHYCGVAACNLPDQTVVGGDSDDLDSLVEELKNTHPRKRSARLRTEGAFHTYYMVEAARHFREHLANTPFEAPAIPVLSNYTGDLHEPSPDAIRSRLFSQLFNPVLWHRNLTNAVDQGAGTIVEFGGGIGKEDLPSTKRPNLEGVVRKTFRRHDSPPRYQGVINMETLEAAVQNLGS